MTLYLPLNANLSSKKPNTLLNQSTLCPFCDRKNLDKNKLINQNGKVSLIENLYPMVENSYQTVLIEHDTCEYDFSNYPKDILYNVLDFAIENWLKMNQSDDFTSAILFKNHGPYSGGSIFHPHMQIIGFNDIDYHEEFSFNNFEGIIIEESTDVVWNISALPKTEFYEFNLILKNKRSLHEFADKLQKTVHFILNYLNPSFKSYNLAFYEADGDIFLKIISKGPLNSGVNSILYLAYNIHQVPTNIVEIKNQIQSIYL